MTRITKTANATTDRLPALTRCRRLFFICMAGITLMYALIFTFGQTIVHNSLVNDLPSRIIAGVCLAAMAGYYIAAAVAPSRTTK